MKPDLELDRASVGRRRHGPEARSGCGVARENGERAIVGQEGQPAVKADGRDSYTDGK